MNKAEKLKRKLAIIKIDQEAVTPSHNYGMYVNESSSMLGDFTSIALMMASIKRSGKKVMPE